RDVERLTDLREELVDALQCLGGVVDFHEHREFVAAEPGDQIRRRKQRPQAPPDFHEQLVTQRMTQGVIHLFEAIEVDQQYGNGPLGGELFIQAFVEQRSVRQRREWVVRGE